jgi:hypothetical protein
MLIGKVWASVEKGESKEVEQRSKLSDFASTGIRVILRYVERIFGGRPVSHFHVLSWGSNSLGSIPLFRIKSGPLVEVNGESVSIPGGILASSS